jgi:3-oxoacyl-[acyl-carrier protein] reductase
VSGRSDKVRVNAIAPGHTQTEGPVDMGLFEGDAGMRMAANTPLGRLGTPGDIAPAVVFLASDESAWSTGEVIRASGGLK